MVRRRRGRKACDRQAGPAGAALSAGPALVPRLRLRQSRLVSAPARPCAPGRGRLLYPRSGAGGGRGQLHLCSAGCARARRASVARRGVPVTIVSETGPELTSRAVLAWTNRVRLDGTTLPGKPQQNAFVESFIGGLRDELLNGRSSRTSPTPPPAPALAARLAPGPAASAHAGLPLAPARRLAVGPGPDLSMVRPRARSHRAPSAAINAVDSPHEPGTPGPQVRRSASSGSSHTSLDVDRGQPTERLEVPAALVSKREGNLAIRRAEEAHRWSPLHGSSTSEKPGIVAGSK